jgi:hypothetical protein
MLSVSLVQGGFLVGLLTKFTLCSLVGINIFECEPEDSDINDHVVIR